MRLDFEIARRGYRRYAAYPAATGAGIFTNTIFGLMLAYILLAVYESRTDVGGWDATDAVTYVWFGQAMLMTVYAFGWYDVALRIRSGDIAADLARPIDPLRYALAFDSGRAVYHFVFRGIPPFVLGAIVFDLRLPSNAGVWLVTLVSLALAVAVSFGWRYLYNTAAFWLLDYRGIGTLAISVSLLFSGFVIPLTFFPDWLEQIARALPFAAMVQIPVDIFLEQATGAELAFALLVQGIWAVVLLGLARISLAAGTRKLVIQGG